MKREIDRVKEYWDGRPCNLRHSSAPVGTARYFAEVTARKYGVESHIPEFAQFERWSGKQVLEIGCGIGTDAEQFVSHGARYTGIDLSGESVLLTRKRLQLLVDSNPAVRTPSVYQWNIEIPVVGEWERDLVYSFGVLHHTPHPDVALRNIRDYLKNAGELRIMLYHRWSWKVLEITRFRPWRSDLIARYSEAQEGCPVTYAYSRRQARKLLESCGFRVESARVEHIFPFDVRHYREYRYVKRPIFRWMPKPLFRILERTLGWHLLIVARKANV